MPRTTPPDWRTMLPVVRAILVERLDGVKDRIQGDRLFYLVYAAAGTDLSTLSMSCEN